MRQRWAIGGKALPTRQVGAAALFVGAALAASLLWFFFDRSGGSGHDYVELQGPATGFPSATEVLESSTVNADQRIPLPVAPGEQADEQTEMKPDAVASASGFELRGHEFYYDGVPIKSVPLERWKTPELSKLLSEIRDQQVETLGSSVNAALREQTFLSSSEFSRQKLWFSDEVHFMVQRPSINEDGTVEMEDGFVTIPRSLCPDAYRLRDLTRRVYATPAYSAKLLDEGLAYERDVVLPQHPDAISEVTPDLTVWTFYSPEGAIVGQVYHTVNANN